MRQETVELIVKNVLNALNNQDQGSQIPVGVSNRHIHLSKTHLEALFGSGYELTRLKDLRQVGEFAAKETVMIVGPKGNISNVRILGPLRKVTQIEISRTDSYLLGAKAPVRDSGDIEGSPGIVVVGPKGAINLERGVICAARHIHMQEEEAQRFKLKDGDRVSVQVEGQRGGIFNNVLVRVNKNFRLEFHLDTDEANALELKTGDQVNIAP